jgi:DNA-binding NarL/FixJ family response regulator
MNEYDMNRSSDGRARVLLVDDHPIVRQGIGMLLSQTPDLAVCGEADGAAEALEAIDRTRPDVAVVDLSLKDSSGLDLIKDIRSRAPDVLILVLSMRDDAFYAERALLAGAKGYITKEEGTQRVIEGLREVLKGEIYLSQKLASTVMKKLIEGGHDSAGPSAEKLTDRELGVLELIGHGLPTREIAKRLHISVKTVDSHREHIKEKLQLGNATELIKYAIQWAQTS